MEIYYLSFAGNEGFRGVCLVEADGAVEAVRTAHRLGINPGGEAMIAHVSRETYAKAPAQLPFNRLMDKATLIRLGGPVETLAELEKEGYQSPHPALCADCNEGED